jgi:hypothetical protein
MGLTSRACELSSFEVNRHQGKGAVGFQLNEVNQATGATIYRKRQTRCSAPPHSQRAIPDLDPSCIELAQPYILCVL